MSTAPMAQLILVEIGSQPSEIVRSSCIRRNHALLLLTRPDSTIPLQTDNLAGRCQIRCSDSLIDRR